MDIKDMSAAAMITDKLKAAGFRAAFLPFSSIELIKQIYEGYSESESAPFSAKDWFLSKQPPDTPFEPLSILIVAFQSPGGEIHFKHEGIDFSLPIPPAYLDDSTIQRLGEQLISAADGYQLAKVSAISLKLLAVLGGLGKYGRNNLCYLDGFGSYCNFDAYYTDIPFEGKANEPVFMDSCESCGLCIGNCPNEALGGQLAIDTPRCLTLWNEHEGAMPDWLSPGVHHAVVGCMRCQEVCPANKAVTQTKKEALELSEAEIEALLTSPPDDIPPELAQKLLDYGVWKMLVSLAGRNVKLAMENSR